MQPNESEREHLRRFHTDHKTLRKRVGLVVQRISAVFRRVQDGDYDELACDEIRSLLRDVEQRLHEHFAEEERVGFLSQAVDVAPRLSRRAASLLDQHDNFRAQLAHLAEQVRTIGDSSERWGAVDAEARAFAEAFGGHEQAENALIQEALMLDAGTGD